MKKLSLQKIFFIVSFNLLLLAYCNYANKPEAINPNSISKFFPQEEIICDLNKVDRKKSPDISLCSFNIKFLGLYKYKNTEKIAKILHQSCDIIIIQELVTNQNIDFFNEMKAYKYNFIKSEKGTGSEKYQEWPITFYDQNKFKPVISNFSGFIDHNTTNNKIFDRVPYVFQFKIVNSNIDLILISLHLHFGFSQNDRKKIKNKPSLWRQASKIKRKRELQYISNWVNKTHQQYKLSNILMAGDFNIANLSERETILPKDMITSNNSCVPTNLNRHKSPKCYDDIVFFSHSQIKSNPNFGFKVLDLQCLTHSPATTKKSKFSEKYSDHNPILIRVSNLYN